MSIIEDFTYFTLFCAAVVSVWIVYDAVKLFGPEKDDRSADKRRSSKS